MNKTLNKGTPPGNFSLKPWPLGILAKTWATPYRFSTSMHLWFVVNTHKCIVVGNPDREGKVFSVLGKLFWFFLRLQIFNLQKSFE